MNISKQLAKSLDRNQLDAIRLIGSICDLKQVKAFLVGGTVRDVVLGGDARDIDIAMECHPSVVTNGISSNTELKVISESNFGTQKVEIGDVKIDLAMTRTEEYSDPSVLPNVSLSVILEDLKRRDFTANSIAMSISHACWGQVLDPMNGLLDIQKKQIIKNVKSLYKAKGTKRASEIFFKLLFNEPAEIRYPKDEIFRASDGKWDYRKILRCLELGTSDASTLVGQTITQADDPTDATVNKATAIVEDVYRFLIGGVTVTELVLGDDSVSGTFVAGQTITGTDNTDADVLVSLSVSSIIDNKTITNDGGLYSEDDDIALTAGGTGATLKVGTIGPGTIQEVVVNAGGSGYAVGDTVNFDSGNAAAKVSVVNGGVTLESGTGTGQLILQDETGKEDQYFGNKVVQESGTGNGDITDIRMIDYGNGYTT